MTSPPPPTRPRFITPRTPGNRTFGPAIAKVGALLGTPFMPWQHDAANLIGEVDAAGRHVWSTVVITVPRQSGKTTLLGANDCHRCMSKKRAKVWRTAQTGQDARRKWLEVVEALKESQLAPLAVDKRTNGSEGLLFVNGSALRPFPPTEDALHGEQSDLVDVDEGWSFDAAEGDRLIQAIVPTQATRPGAQTVVVSTMGTAESVWFHDLVDKGRAGAPGIALVDYGIGPDVDPTDLDAVAAAHPAYGYTIDRAALERAAGVMTPAQFARAYGNRPTSTRERLLPESLVAAAFGADPIPADALVAFGAAVAYDRTSSAIVAVAQTGPDVFTAEVIDVRPGVAWTAERLHQLATTHPNAGVVIDRAGPAGSVADAYTRLDPFERHPLLPFTVRDLASSTADLLDRMALTPPGIRFQDHSAMRSAFDVATLRQVGDGRIWSRRGSAGSVAPLEAATLGLIGIRANTRSDVAPAIRF